MLIQTLLTFVTEIYPNFFKIDAILPSSELCTFYESLQKAKRLTYKFVLYNIVFKESLIYME